MRRRNRWARTSGSLLTNFCLFRQPQWSLGLTAARSLSSNNHGAGNADRFSMRVLEKFVLVIGPPSVSFEVIDIDIFEPVIPSSDGR